MRHIFKKRGTKTIIFRNTRITAMTGHQQNPASGMTLSGEPAHELDLEALCRAVGIKHVTLVDPHDIPATRKVVEAALELDEPAVVITKAPCVLIPEHRKKKRARYFTKTANCVGCRQCISIGCPAISWVPLTPEEAIACGYKEKQKGHSLISDVLCDGCGQCFHLCKFDAIHKEDEPR